MQALSTQNLEILLQLGLAVVLGGAIGLEREHADKPAGFRTHILVCTAAAFLVALGELLNSKYALALGNDFIQTDPIRVIEAVITGISFLGAGTILRHKKGPIEGLTTAASLFFAATIGIAVGLSAYVLATIATVMVIVILIVGVRIEKWLGIRQ